MQGQLSPEITRGMWEGHTQVECILRSVSKSPASQEDLVLVGWAKCSTGGPPTPVGNEERSSSWPFWTVWLLQLSVSLLLRRSVHWIPWESSQLVVWVIVAMGLLLGPWKLFLWATSGEWRQCKGSWRSRGWLSSPFSSLSFPFFLPSGSRKLQKSQSLGKLLGDSQGTAEPAETVWGL